MDECRSRLRRKPQYINSAELAHTATDARQYSQGDTLVADSSHSMGTNEKIASHDAIVIAKPAVNAASLSFSTAFTSSTHLGIFARPAHVASRASRVASSCSGQRAGFRRCARTISA